MPNSSWDVQVSFTVFQSKQEENRIKNQQYSEIAAAERDEQTILSQERTYKNLSRQLEEQDQVAKAYDKRVTEARKVLAEVEKAHHQAIETAHTTALEIEMAKQQMKLAVASLERHKESAAFAGAALEAAKAEVEAKKLLFNPLNHPVVKHFLAGR